MPVAVKKISISLPDTLWAKVEEISQAESRTRSELIREMIRHYADDFDAKRRQQQSPSTPSLPKTARR